LYNPNHVLHQLMPPEKVNSHNLRERSHNLTIPLIVNNILRKKFLFNRSRLKCQRRNKLERTA